MKITFRKFFFVIFLSFSNLLYLDVTPEQEALLETLPPDQRAGVLSKMQISQDLGDELEIIFEEPTLIKRPDLEGIEEGEEICETCIYGYDFFKFSPSTFAPVGNTPISSNYVLGPGDKIEINFYGASEGFTESIISREGIVFVPLLGPVNLLGKTFSEAESYLQNITNQKLISTNVSISLIELRSISVYILGEAYNPGKYIMSGLSSVTNALFIGGGVNKNGSLRNIQIKRNNKLIAKYDFYEFLLKGSLDSDVALQDGDVIFIPFIENTVHIGGAFKRPYKYEFIEGENLEDAINLAGGFTSEVLQDSKIEHSSINLKTSTREVKYISQSSDELKKLINNNDAINIPSSSGVSSKTVKITGEVNKPGEYSIQKGDNILDIINRAGGITDEGYSEGAVYLRKSVAELQKAGFLRSADELENTIVEIITKGSIDNISEYTLSPISALITRLREEEPLERLVVDLDYLSLKTDPFQNFSVQEGDSVFIPQRPNSVSVVGEVLNGSTLGFNPKFGVQDYLELAGGLNESADPGRIFIIYPNGKSQIVKRSLFRSSNNLLPGSTIVIPRNARPLDAVNLTQIITPILADLATSAAAIAAISNN